MDGGDLFDPTAIIAYLEYSTQISYILHQPKTMRNILDDALECSSTT